MPNIKSAKKRVKVSEKKNLRNRMVKNAVRTSIKKFEAAMAEPATAAAQLTATTSAIDKAAAKGVIHKNQASNRKSGVAKLVNKISA